MQREICSQPCVEDWSREDDQHKYKRGGREEDEFHAAHEERGGVGADGKTGRRGRHRKKCNDLRLPAFVGETCFLSTGLTRRKL